MKKEVTFTTRVRWAIRYIFKPNNMNGVYNKCSVCQSPNIKLLENVDYDNSEDVCSMSRMVCLSCGALAGASQTWKKPKK